MNGHRAETLDEQVAQLQQEIDEEESEIARELIRNDMRDECFKLEGTMKFLSFYCFTHFSTL